MKRVHHRIPRQTVAFLHDLVMAGLSFVLALVLRHAFGPLGLHRLEANIQPGNAPSRRLVERLGFRHEGRSERYLKIGGRWRDHDRFALVAEDRRPRQARRR